MSTQEQPFGRDYWEDRYAGPELTWSGNPNPVLVSEATPLTPARALDIGSGEGGDAIWLAMQGWQVTSVDIAENALDKARRHAESIDQPAAARIQWLQRDLTIWSPPQESYELVSSQFMHLPEPHRTQLFRWLAAAVAPGGTLLIVGHDLEVNGAGPAHHRELMFDVDDVLSAIQDQALVIEVAESRSRPADGHHHGDTELHDVVVKATRAS